MSIRDLIPWTRPGVPAGSAPPDPFTSLQREMNRLFDNAFRDFRVPEPFTRAVTGIWPTIAVAEQEKTFVVTAELPGMEEKDIEVSLDDSALVIRGEKKSQSTETKPGDDKTHVDERFWGRFERRIPIGPEVARDGVTASFENGVLTVTLSKSPDAAKSSRRIPISPRPARAA